MRLKSLKTFKKGKREVYVDFTKNIVTWKKEHYKLKIINGVPYVAIEEVKPRSKIIYLINAAYKNKRDLKFIEYKVDNNTYYIIGIGDVAIKAYKNDSNRAEFFSYFTIEGQKLLKEITKGLDGVLV